MKENVIVRPIVRRNGVDVFFAINLLLFGGMCLFAYYARWMKYAGSRETAAAEFFFYATVLILANGGLWFWLRRYPFPNWMLVLIEIGILLHFAGGLVHYGGARLYDHVYGPMRYDKFVHVINTLFAASVVQELFRLKQVPITAFTRFAIFWVALGLGERD